MGAYYSKGGSHSILPPVVTATISDLQSDNTAYGYNLSHLLPLRGSFAGSINRSTWNTNYLDVNSNGSIDTMNAAAGVHPTGKLSVTATANYSDNLTGQIIQSVLGAGGVTPILNSDQSSNSLDLMTVATYTPVPNLQTAGFFERRTQTFLGENYGVKSYGGNASFTHKLLEGTIQFVSERNRQLLRSKWPGLHRYFSIRELQQPHSRLARKRIVQLRAERADAADQLHEFVLQLLSQHQPQLGTIQHQRRRRRRPNRA